MSDTANEHWEPVFAVDFNMPHLKAHAGLWTLTPGQRVFIDDYESLRGEATVTALSREKCLAYLHVEGKLEHYGPNA